MSLLRHGAKPNNMRSVEMKKYLIVCLILVSILMGAAAQTPADVGQPDPNLIGVDTA